MLRIRHPRPPCQSTDRHRQLAADPNSDNGPTVGDGITSGTYWTSWQFNPLGQRTRQTQHGLSGAADTVTTYTAYGFEIGDQQDTAIIAIDNTFTTPTWRQETPYGAPRGMTPATWPDNHGFLNKPVDTATGLTDVGGRWYDPDTGTFASLDPLFEATDSQQQNAYTYASANPITNSDPTGLNGCTISDGLGCRWTDPTVKNHNGAGVTGGNKDYCSRFNCNRTDFPDNRYRSVEQAVAAQEAAIKAADQAAAQRLAMLQKIAQTRKPCSGFWGCIGHDVHGALNVAGALAPFATAIAIGTAWIPGVDVPLSRQISTWMQAA